MQVQAEVALGARFDHHAETPFQPSLSCAARTLSMVRLHVIEQIPPSPPLASLLPMESPLGASGPQPTTALEDVSRRDAAQRPSSERAHESFQSCFWLEQHQGH
ncbi:hypothetical protein DPSP01_010512 [Paraphaeosphaeria sporulosa]